LISCVLKLIFTLNVFSEERNTLCLTYVTSFTSWRIQLITLFVLVNSRLINIVWLNSFKLLILVKWWILIFFWRFSLWWQILVGVILWPLFIFLNYHFLSLIDTLHCIDPTELISKDSMAIYSYFSIILLNIKLYLFYLSKLLKSDLNYQFFKLKIKTYLEIPFSVEWRNMR
jgi:hypothetical protein